MGFWTYLSAVQDNDAMPDWCRESCDSQVQAVKRERATLGADIGSCTAAVSRVVTCLRDTSSQCSASNFYNTYDFECARQEAGKMHRKSRRRRMGRRKKAGGKMHRKR